MPGVGDVVTFLVSGQAASILLVDLKVYRNYELIASKDVSNHDYCPLLAAKEAKLNLRPMYFEKQDVSTG